MFSSCRDSCLSVPASNSQQEGLSARFHNIKFGFTFGSPQMWQSTVKIHYKRQNLYHAKVNNFTWKIFFPLRPDQPTILLRSSPSMDNSIYSNSIGSCISTWAVSMERRSFWTGSARSSRWILLRANVLDHCTQLWSDNSQIFIGSFKAFGTLCFYTKFPSDELQWKNTHIRPPIFQSACTFHRQ